MARASVKKPSLADFVAQARRLPPVQRMRLVGLLNEELRGESLRQAQEAKQPLTAKALLDSGLVGLWRNRVDIRDTSAFARDLRERAQKRTSS
jgi:hypothetical protein